METLKVFSMLFLLAGAYLFVGDDDYHKMFDKPQLIRYNCDIVNGDWNPDVPVEVIKECKKMKEKYVKTY